MNEIAVLKIVVGASIPLWSGFRGRKGCSAKTANPTTSVIRLNSMNAIAYCFQFCGPVSIRCSIHLSHLGSR